LRKGKFTALIAVREGSKRVPRKNIKKFADSSLLEIKIEQALKAKGIDEIVVSSDSDEMINLARGMKVKTIKRPSKFCSDSVQMKYVYKHLAESVKCDHIVYLHVTSPLLEISTLNSCIFKYKELDNSYSSLASVEHLMKYIWFNNNAINYDPKNHPRSQDLDKYYCLNFAVNIISREDMINTQSILGNKFYPYLLNEIESIDVDNQIQFDMAEYVYKKYKF
tara:strand:+ start:690 stop:1355 length:666 start_codon:yes stop_codon:yes gene_type:complete